MGQQKIQAVELQARLNAGDPIQIIDVRSASEYQSGHIPQASNVPMEVLESRLEDLSPHRQVVLVCHSGNRACLTEEWLRDHHDQVTVLEGGTQAWVEANLPVVGDAPKAWALDRQVRFAAGMMVLVGTILAVNLNPNWIYLAMFVGAGLTFSGITNTCGMGMLLAKAPWNKVKSAPSKKATGGAA